MHIIPNTEDSFVRVTYHVPRSAEVSLLPVQLLHCYHWWGQSFTIGLTRELILVDGRSTRMKALGWPVQVTPSSNKLVNLRRHDYVLIRSMTRLLGLIIRERWIEETDMVLESYKHACMIIYHVWCEIASVFSVYIWCALLGTASKNYSYTGRLHSMRCLSIIVVLISHLPISCHGDKKKTSSSCKLCLPKVFIGVVPSRRARDGRRPLQVVHLWFPMGLLMNLESIVNPKIIE